MSDEPIYCSACGVEWGEGCDHGPHDDGPYCQVCGIIPAPGLECKFYTDSDREECGIGTPNVAIRVNPITVEEAVLEDRRIAKKLPS